MDISIIVVNYKSESFLTQCISSLQKFLTSMEFEIIIINNDPSIELEKTLACNLSKVRVLRNNTNRGFAKACNLGASIAAGKFLFFLNPDTQLLTDIQAIIKIFNDPRVAIVAPKLLLPSEKVQPWSCGYSINLWDTIKNNFGFRKSERLWSLEYNSEVDWVSGAAFFISKKTFDLLSGFDEKFFMYFEDADFCKRAQEKHFKILIAPEVIVLHVGGASKASKRNQKKQFYESQDYYFQKHCGPTQTFFLKLLRKIATFQ